MVDKIRKIYCIERTKKSFDKKSIEEVENMCGTIIPDVEGKWDVQTMFEGEGFECKDQTHAEILAGIEEIKAMLVMLLQKNKKRG